MKNKTLFIFDVDGTLVNAYDAIHRSLNFTRRAFRYPEVNYQTMKYAIGHGDRHFIETFFDKSHVDEALQIFMKHHEKAVLRYSKALPHARNVLYRLKQKKKMVAVATNRPKKFTHLILKKVDLHRYMDKILCADEVKAHKPKPKILHEHLTSFKVARKDAVYIGDMDVDMETAKRARVQGVFVKGGSSRPKDVMAYKGIEIIPNLKKILTLI